MPSTKAAKPPTKKTGLVKIAEIVRDPNLQFRVDGVKPDHVAGMRETLRAGGKLPKVELWEVAGVGKILADGWHRVQAHEGENRAEIDAVIFRGTLAQARMAAANANLKQLGMPLDTKSRRKVAKEYLTQHPDWTDKRIAKVTGVTAASVGNYRRELEAEQAIEEKTVRTGTDGKQHAVPTKPSVKDEWKAKPVEDFLKVPRVILQELHNKDVVTAGDLAQALTNGKLNTIREEDKKLLSDQLADLAGGKSFTPDRTPKPSKNGSPTTFDWSEWESCLGRMVNMQDRMRQVVKNPEGADYLALGRNLGNVAELTKQIKKQCLREQR